MESMTGNSARSKVLCDWVPNRMAPIHMNVTDRQMDMTCNGRARVRSGESLVHRSKEAAGHHSDSSKSSCTTVGQKIKLMSANTTHCEQLHCSCL